MKVFRGGVLLGVVLLAGCAGSPLREAEDHAAKEQWLKAIAGMREAYAKNPGDIELRSAMLQYELRAAEFYYQRGLAALSDDEVESAIGLFEQGLAAMPQNEKLETALRDARNRKEAETLYRQAMRNVEARNFRDAAALLQKAIEKSPSFDAARAALEGIRKQQAASSEKEFALTSSAPITLNFKQTDLRTAFGFLASSFGINVIFDEAVTDKEVTLFAKDVTFRQALTLMLTTSKTFYKKVGDNTILIAPDTKEKRGQYDDYLIRTFYLQNANAKEMADLIKGVVSLQKVVINERLNTVTVRETPEVLKLVEDILSVNDDKPAEVVLEVEILEVDRNKSERLGFNFGSALTAKFPEYQFSGAIGDAFDAGHMALPSVTFNYFKQKVDAKTLANPKIRAVNGRPARIHIGDRVPLRSSTITDATGQVRTTYEYTDIGIRLIVDPNVYMDNSTLVKVGLEVSSLGENLGTTEEPAYSIGTRNAETFMLLEDGETAIVGGLIRDEDRRTRVSVPGLGDIPLAGALFTSKDDSFQRSDVLLTITPRVIRPWTVAADDVASLYSGTAETYSINPRISNDTQARAATFASARAGARPALPPAVRRPVIEFAAEEVSAKSGEELTVELRARNLRGRGRIPLEVFFDPKTMEFVKWVPHGGEETKPMSRDPGAVKLTVEWGEPGDAASVALGRLQLRAKQRGVSHVMLGKTTIVYASGGREEARVHAVRIDAE